MSQIFSDRKAKMKNIIFYVSEHGYGHTARTAEIIRWLKIIESPLRVHARTHRSGTLLETLSNVVFTQKPYMLDCGAAEISPLEIDKTQTLKRLSLFLETCEQARTREANYINENKIELVVADIPFLAGDIAQEANIPCVAVGNFTWDWIYGAYVCDDSRWSDAIERIKLSYSLMSAWLRLPFHHDSDSFKRIIDVPLVSRKSKRDTGEVLDNIGVPKNDRRLRILVAMRGDAGLLAPIISMAATRNKDFIFLSTAPMRSTVPENVLIATPVMGVNFEDILSICDVAVSKFGYFIISACISNNTALLCPKRQGFREDEIFRREAGQYVRTKELSNADYVSGDWRRHILDLLRMQPPIGTIQTDGAEVCAKTLLQWSE